MTGPQPAQPPEPSTKPVNGRAQAGPRPELPALTAARNLATVAERLEASMAPVEPRPAFLDDLSRRLAEDRPKALAEAHARKLRVWWMAGVGGVLSVLGVGYVCYRTLKLLEGRSAHTA